MVTCGGCGKEMRAGNLARHQRGACRVWDTGEGANPKYVEWTRAGELAADRERWSSKVKERMQHLEEWQRGRGNENRNDHVERNPGWEEIDPLKCRWEGCGKICKSKGGLAIHIRRMHDAAKANLKFKCGACGMKFKSENTMINLQKVCGGAPPPPDREGEEKV